jgi:hypothetical protein
MFLKGKDDLQWKAWYTDMVASQRKVIVEVVFSDGG